MANTVFPAFTVKEGTSTDASPAVAVKELLAKVAVRSVLGVVVSYSTTILVIGRLLPGPVTSIFGCGVV